MTSLKAVKKKGLFLWYLSDKLSLEQIKTSNKAKKETDDPRNRVMWHSKTSSICLLRGWTDCRIINFNNCQGIQNYAAFPLLLVFAFGRDNETSCNDGKAPFHPIVNSTQNLYVENLQKKFPLDCDNWFVVFEVCQVSGLI